MNEVREWLERLYGQSPGYFGITPFAGGRPQRTRWFKTSELDAADKTIKATSERHKADLYLSVGTHEAPQKTRGGEATIISIPGLWADIDIGEFGHKPASSGLPNPPTEEAALSIVEGMPEPSMLLHSGGGLQAFWLFDEPWMFEGPEDKARAKQAVQGWGNLLALKGRERGFHVDKVADLARILRTPGSVNHKEGQTRPIQIRWVDKPRFTRAITELGIPDSEPTLSSKQDDDFPMTWDEILAPHGYKRCGDRGWVRPGKKCSEGISLSVPPDAPFVITNWSESDDRLPVGKGTKLTKLKVYALLNHKGDEAKAQKAVANRPRKLVLTPASEIAPKPVHWLWQGRIAMGTLALLAGREGIGKSTLAYTIVAMITKGKLPGKYEGISRCVIIVATEDSWEFTIVPRLMAAEADLSKVFRVEAADPDEYGVSLPRDIGELSSIALQSEVALILLDPLMSRVDSKLDTHKDSEVRQALEPLVRMADKGGAAVLGLIHVNKSGSSDPLTSLMGSRAFSAVSRAVLYVAEDPDNPEIKVVGQPKNNLGRSDLPELTYSLTQVSVGEWEGEIITSVTLKWEKEQKPGRLRTILSTKTQRSRTDDAATWLEFYLHQNGRSLSKDIKEAGEKEGYSESTLKRAAANIGVVSTSEGFPRVTYWELPGSEFLFEDGE